MPDQYEYRKLAAEELGADEITLIAIIRAAYAQDQTEPREPSINRRPALDEHVAADNRERAEDMRHG